MVKCERIFSFVFSAGPSRFSLVPVFQGNLRRASFDSRVIHARVDCSRLWFAWHQQLVADFKTRKALWNVVV